MALAFSATGRLSLSRPGWGASVCRQSRQQEDTAWMPGRAGDAAPIATSDDGLAARLKIGSRTRPKGRNGNATYRNMGRLRRAGVVDVRADGGTGGMGADRAADT